MAANDSTSGRDTFRKAIEFRSPGYVPCLIGERLELDWLYEKDEAKVRRIEELKNRFPEDLLELGDCWVESPINDRGRSGRWLDRARTGGRRAGGDGH